MSTLHVVSGLCLTDCLGRAAAGDSVLLVQRGVLAALTLPAASVPIYLLGPDLDRWGLGNFPLDGRVQVVDYDGFVDLAARHAVVHSWL